MRAPTRPELLLAVLALSAFGMWRAGVNSIAAKEAELELVRSEREAVQRENDALRAAKDQVDRIAADSIAQLNEVVEDAELRASEVSAEGPMRPTSGSSRPCPTRCQRSERWSNAENVCTRPRSWY